MTVRWDTINVDGRSMRAYVAVPAGTASRPAIIVAHHIDGVNEWVQDAVHRLYREGYIVAAPELFHRQPADVGGASRSGLLRDEEIIVDLKATLAHVKTLGVSAAVGVVGFCMGGRVSYLAACAIGGLKAAAVFYGGRILKALGDGPSPLERSAGIECPLLGLFGVEDENPSPADVAKIDAELTRLGKWHEFHMYQDTGHGFLNFLRSGRYRERAARGAWAEMLAFFDERLTAG